MGSRTEGQETRAVNLRMRDEVRALIDRAAKSQGQTRSDFMISAARRAAEETLVAQTFVQVDAESFDHYRAILDEPASGDQFDRLMRAPQPWAK